ncbi:unnamed protein product [Rotaria magnacalcarata]|uniref:Uncharacterized protein n=5 Tax=Rotaria magnacalcarata TaxID=392030 RepID=A0A814JUX9_9BILA|nr:unnamed protein product [Rotaria magnacalcarata]
MNQEQLMLEWKQMCEQLGKDPLNKELIQKMKKTQMKLQTVTRSSENESSNDRTKKMKNENFHKGLNEDLSEDSNESSNEVFTERSSQESNDDLNDSLHEHNEEQIKNSEQRPSILVMNPLVKLHIDTVGGAYDDRRHSENIYPYLALNDLHEKIKQSGYNVKPMRPVYRY